MSMRHSEFVIGQAFTTGHGLWRCTDIGTRTVVAIRIDAAEVVSVLGGRETQSIVDPRRDLRGGSVSRYSVSAPIGGFPAG